MSDKDTERRSKRTPRKARATGGFAVGYEITYEGEAATVWLVHDLPDTAAAEAWLREHGEAASKYTVAQIKRSGLRVEVREVRRARLV